jgi:TRAP transporter TAXI family solute receptor
MSIFKKGILTLATVLLSSTVLAETLTIEGGGASSTTGLVPQSLAPYSSKAGIDLQVVLNQVLTKSIMKVAAGKLDLAVAPPPAYKAMTMGKGPYAKSADVAKKLAPKVKALFAFQGSTMHPTVWADSGIKTWNDIRGKRVFIGPPAGAAASQSTGMIKAASGLEAGKDYEPVKVPWGQAAQAFKDGQFDVYIAFYPIGSQIMKEIGAQRDVRVLGIPESVFSSKEWADYEKKSGVQGVFIPAGTYENGFVSGSEKKGAAATGMMVIANESMSVDKAYTLTKTFFEALPEMKKSNALLRSQDGSKPLFGVTARIHDGAKKYYKEVGIEVPSNLQ